jgi:hypothetical protein
VSIGKDRLGKVNLGLGDVRFRWASENQLVFSKGAQSLTLKCE